MSVAMIITDRNREQRMIPVATERTYEDVWQTGARALGLDWVELMQTGVEITSENRAEVGQQLKRLGVWFADHGHTYENVRLGTLLGEIEGLQFDNVIRAWVG